MGLDIPLLAARAAHLGAADRIERGLLVALALVVWFWTQAVIGKRRAPEGKVSDRIHDFTAPLHDHLRRHPGRANALLIGSSAVIDLLGIGLIVVSVLGPSVQPFVGLLILFALRQACQFLVALPEPPGMIWRSPGFPSLLVTYGTANDLFFSGHTAIAVYAACEGLRIGPFALGLALVVVAVLEASTVLVLRAHYTMDVFAAVFTSIFASAAAAACAPAVDAALRTIAARISS